MRCLRCMCGVTRINRVRNEEVRRTGVSRELSGRVEQSVVSWFGHVERMVTRIMRADIYEWSEVGRKPTDERDGDGYCEGSFKWKMYIGRAREVSCAWSKQVESNGLYLNMEAVFTTSGGGIRIRCGQWANRARRGGVAFREVAAYIGTLLWMYYHSEKFMRLVQPQLRVHDCIRMNPTLEWSKHS